jgi:hypothetical protein
MKSPKYQPQNSKDRLQEENNPCNDELREELYGQLEIFITG